MRRFKMTLHIIAAACENNGIGNEGQLPWRLKKEMTFFKEMTSRVENSEKQNAVIMGRKTWFSIPEKVRPLSKRINVVLTTTQLDIPGPDYVTDSFEKAMNWLQSSDVKEKLEKIFVIGGETVYKIAMNSDHRQVLYLTRIREKFECDAFFPEIDYSCYSPYQDPYVPVDEQEENGIRYKYECYIKNGC